MKILIIEDDEGDLTGIKKDCQAGAVNSGIPLNAEDFVECRSLSDALHILQGSDFSFDIIIADVMLTGGDLPYGQIEDQLLQQDILKEAKFIVYTGQKIEKEDILHALHGGAHNYVLKGFHDDQRDTLKVQLNRTMRQIRRESFWSKVGRFSPEWKRIEFADFNLWDRLEGGFRTSKAILWCDLTQSTKFVNYQRGRAKADKDILEFFRRFFTEHSEIIERQDYEGIIDKFIGDEILAYFCGDRVTDDTEKCHRAIDAALELRDNYTKWYDPVIEKLGLARVPEPDRPKVRILVHWGEVMWSVLGADNYSCLTLMTETMVKGKRVLDHCNDPAQRVIQPGEVCITEDAYTKIVDKSRYNFDGKRIALTLRDDFGDVDIHPILSRA
jgi:class 3 adenylate cyclase/DNA-binding response OmpR family regulator